MVVMLGYKIFSFLVFGFMVNGNVIKNDSSISSSTISVLAPKAQLASDQVNAYQKKICSGEPTCHLVDQVPEEYRTIPPRSCMCDSQCSRFGDCCLDSPFYNETQQRLVHGTFECKNVDSIFGIYIKNKCPPNFGDSIVKTKCESWSEKLKSVDTKLVTPVSNVATQVTYANEYCALCNHDENVVAWNVTYECDFPNYSFQYESFVKLNAEMKTFYIDFNGTRGNCIQSRTPPPRWKSRNCRSNVWSCPKNTTYANAELCKTFMYLVFDEKFTAYKNVHCAACNGIKNAVNCVQVKSVPFTSFATAFTVIDKASGSGNPCADSADAAIKEKFCR